MTAGIPGAGIGGMFYMLSAIAMPFHAAYRSVRRRRNPHLAGEPPVRWRPVFRQFAIGVGIVIALWLTGWVLGGLVTAHPSALGGMQSPVPGRTVPNVIKIGALILSLGTLCVVLVAVQISRLVLSLNWRKSITALLVAALVALSASRAFGQKAGEIPGGVVASHLTAAETAYEAGDTATAAAEYAKVIALEPDNSRALFRLGQLWRSEPARSIPMYRRYVALIPRDPWGHMALGDALAVDGRLSEALREYDEAARLAPAERDVPLGRARVLARAGHTDDAITVLERWTVLHSDDAEALRELGDQRRRAGRFREAAGAYAMAAQRDRSPSTLHRLELARVTNAPAVEVSAAGGGDSDGNRAYSANALASTPIANRARITLSGGRKRNSGFLDALYYDAALGLTMRPLASFRLEAAAGAVRATRNTGVSNPDTVLQTLPDVPGNGRGRGRGKQPPPGTVVRTDAPVAETSPIGFIRAVWKQPGTAALLDVRASRILLDATPVLVINRVMRNEIAGRVDVPVTRRIRLRGGAKADSYDAREESNSRTSLLGGIAASVNDAAEIAAIFQRIAFDHPTTSGYFAPRVAQSGEFAVYAELESETGRLLVIDAGVGGQRFADFGSAIGPWKPAFRLMTQLTVPLRPGSELRAEVDTYDSQLASEAAPGTSWRFASASLSLRFALR